MRNWIPALFVILFFSSCVKQVSTPAITGYVDQEGFELSREEVQLVKAEENFMDVYQLTAVIQGEDSLFITFQALTVGHFKYFQPDKGLNLAQYYDASAGKYYSTHLDADGYGEMDIKREGNVLSGNMTLVMYDAGGRNAVTVSELTLNELTIAPGNVNRVGQLISYRSKEGPAWSRAFRAAKTSAGIRLATQSAPNQWVEITIPQGLTAGTYEFTNPGFEFTIADSTGREMAAEGSLSLTHHHDQLQYIDARFNVRNVQAARVSHPFNLQKGRLRFTYR